MPEALVNGTSRRASVPPRVAPSPRLYDVYLMLDVLHVYDPLGAARVRTGIAGELVLDGPPYVELSVLDRRLVEPLPFEYDGRVGGWRFTGKGAE